MGQRQRIACLVLPGLKMSRFGRPDAEQDAQNLRIAHALRQ